MHGTRSGAAPPPADSRPDLPLSGLSPSDLRGPDPAPPDVPPPDFPPPDLPPPDHPAGIQVLRLADRDATLRRATGSGDARVHGWLVNDLSFALAAPPAFDAPGFGAQARADRVCAAVSAICDIGPRDTLEGMLAAQMIAVQSATLDSLRRAAEPAAADWIAPPACSASSSVRCGCAKTAATRSSPAASPDATPPMPPGVRPAPGSLPPRGLRPPGKCSGSGRV